MSGKTGFDASEAAQAAQAAQVAEADAAKLKDFVRSCVFACSEQHRRAHQEDRWLFKVVGKYVILAVFDGHDGDNCAEACLQFFLNFNSPVHEETIAGGGKAVSRAWLETLFETISKHLEKVVGLKKMKKCGTTATVCFLRPFAGPKEVKLTIAYVGDSPAFCLASTTDNTVIALQLTKDHQPPNAEEQRRMEEHKKDVEEVDKGEIRGDTLWRGKHFLKMTRSFGDRHFSPCGVVSRPEVVHFRSEQLMASGAAPDRFCMLLVASDGWLDRTTLQCEAEKLGREVRSVGLASWQRAVQKHVKERDSSDNTTMIAVRLA